MLHIPTTLTLTHLFNPTHKLTLLSQHPHLKQSPNNIPLPQSSIDLDQQQQIIQLLNMLISDEDTDDIKQYYTQQFIQTFCLIKLNSIVSECCQINQSFIDKFIELYNEKKQLKIKECRNQEEFFAQVILKGELYQNLEISSVQNILAGQCLLATTLAFMIKQTKLFIKKAEVSFALSFLALSGRPQAFISKVHQQKNHYGQIEFASIIREYINIDNPKKYLKIDIESRRVQDPYSMRCAPQVYGVVYDCLQHLQSNFHTILNKFHFKNLSINDQLYPNIELFADSDILKGDYLLCSLNQIGSMSFLRSQRILNIYLGKNEVHKQSPKQVFELKSLLQRTVHCVADNKLIAIPSNIDTMIIDNYQKDIFFTASKMYEKQRKMFRNLYKIMLLQIYSALLGLNNIYEIGQGEIFLNQTLRSQLLQLQKHLSPKHKAQSFQFISKKWMIQ